MEIYTLRESNRYQKFFRKAISILEQSGLSYCVIGGVALSFYDYHRSTTDLDVLIEIDSWNRLGVILSSLDVKRITDRRYRISGYDFELEFVRAGEQLNPNDIIYPNPKEVRKWDTKEHCWVVSLEMLVAMKLYGFTYNRKRLKDGADVQELLLSNLDRRKEFLGWSFEDSRVEKSWREILERTLL